MSELNRYRVALTDGWYPIRGVAGGDGRRETLALGSGGFIARWHYWGFVKNGVLRTLWSSTSHVLPPDPIGRLDYDQYRLDLATKRWGANPVDLLVGPVQDDWADELVVRL